LLGDKLVTEQTFESTLGGRRLVIEAGRVAGQADGAVTMHYGDTVVLVTVCYNKEPREGIDFLPLTIDYEERLYAAGKIPGGFIRREGRPSEEAILACRLTDRPVRPLLPKTWRSEIQIIATVLSADQENDPDILAVIGGSAVLSISDIPFDGPVGAVHVGYIDGEMVLNPTMPQMENSQLDLIVASTRDKVIMLEAGAREISEDIVKAGIRFGHEANQEIIRMQEQLRQSYGKTKLEVPAGELNAEVVEAVSAIADKKLGTLLEYPEKQQREEVLSELKKQLVESLSESFSQADIMNALDSRIKTVVRSRILENEKRMGGRGLTEIRPIGCEVGLLPRTHGSALFTRGQTQVLGITTLGSVSKQQPLDGLGIEESKRFIHHYNFPPFSTGEVKRTGSTSRREIGHGALAERALAQVLPSAADFPYTIRLVSEVMSSSGSTSMASVCAGSLSLMDAGIPIKSAVAGIAMGLITSDDGRQVVLTDIEGWEDAHGDMDFKIAGTREGITAIQMDTKLKGISLEVVDTTLAQGKDARLQILEKMHGTISASRPEVSPYAPRMQKVMINPDKIGAVIGTGGKTIRSIIEQTKTTIDINDDGMVIIGSTDAEAAKRAIEIIENLTKEVEVGSTYTGKVTRVLDFGAMVEILPGKEGMVHISELADYRVPSVEDEVKVGDEVTVKVIGIDNMGRVNLSRRAVFETSPREAGDRAGGSSSSGQSPRRGGPPQNHRPYGGGQRPPGEGRRPAPRRDMPGQSFRDR